MFRKTLLATAAVLALAYPAAALTTDEEVGALKQLPWVRTAGIYTLPISGSKLALPQGDIAVFGAHAQRAYKLLGNPVERSELEAFVVGDTDRDQIQIVTFESHSTGYIGLDDWTQLDPTALLDAIRRGTEAENQQRRQQGISGLHVRGWLQPPTLDRNTATVYWAITADEDDMATTNVNAVALRLGRSGYERLTWIGTQGQYQATGNQLDTMLRAHSFAPGSAYADHISTDKMAGYGGRGRVLQADRLAAEVGPQTSIRRISHQLLWAVVCRTRRASPARKAASSMLFSVLSGGW
jgi:uncharacterized membrane-anchored protein